MNIEEYILSGKLEQYAMGMLPENEAKEVAEAVASYPELAAELEAIHASLLNFAQSAAMTPPAGLENKIWQSIQAESAPKSNQEPIIKNLESKSSNGGWVIKPWLAAASIIFMILSSSLCAFYYTQWNQSHTALVALQEENNHMASEFEAKQASYDLLQNDIKIVTNPDTKMVVMQGLPAFPNAKATIFWHKSTQTVMLKVNQLPAPPEGKQYQLWGIVHGKPVDAGVFDLPKDANGMLKMKGFESASAFAITLEDKGGKISPEGDMYVLGSI